MKRRRKILSIISKDDRFTAFERKVYAAVSKIPRGEVRSYGWVAGKIGHPRSARAVGNALNKNPHTLKIPCHRVVRSDGSLGGYSMGADLKAYILKREGRAAYKISNP